MAVRPAERDLEDLVHVVEKQIRGEFESARHRRLTAQQFDAHPIGHRFGATRATSRRRRLADHVARQPVQASCGRSVTACHRAHLTVSFGHGQIDLPQQSGRRMGTWMPTSGSWSSDTVLGVRYPVGAGNSPWTARNEFSHSGTRRRPLTAAEDIGCDVAW